MQKSLEAIEPYVLHLEGLVREINQGEFDQNRHRAVEAALNGELSRTLRRHVPLKELQNSGAFFTGESMADQLVAPLSKRDVLQGTTLDAACGGGNLLLAYARRMPVESTWGETLNSWGARLKAFDIHEPLVRATRARLALFAAQQGIQKYGTPFLQGETPSLQEAFPEIQTRDSISAPWPQADIVLLNPPFNPALVPERYKWASGRMTYAALFVLKFLEEAQQRTVLRAILPDVLRAGSRYRNWRLEVEKLASVQSAKVIGRFDEETNVDIFMLTLEVCSSKQMLDGRWWTLDNNQSSLCHTESQTVGDLFNVSVGRVVPHRDKDEGTQHHYLDASHVPPWSTIKAGAVQRGFDGTVFQPPFVIIRRNSRSSDSFRAVGTIVKAKTGDRQDVAVENHLIVARPKSGLLKDCQELIGVLRKPETTNWLNRRICCRHLTVEAVNNIPYPDKNPESEC